MSSSNAAGAQMSGPPYQPQVAQLGGIPSNSVDTPICAVFLLLFIIAGAIHMTVLQVNLKRGHKFIFSGLLFGLSMARIVALTMRIVWANRLTNVNIAIAANVFTNAGVIILFVVDILFAKRIVRGYHPSLGRQKWYDSLFNTLVFLIVAMLFSLIGCTVAGFFTLDTNKRLAFRDFQRFASVFFAVLSFLPIPMVLLAMWWPSRLTTPTPKPEKFGTGKWRTKLLLLLSSSAILTLGAAFRAGISFMARPKTDPAWFHSKACYYCFIFLIEIIVSLTYAGTRFDKRFHIPLPMDGSSKSGVPRDEEQQLENGGAGADALPGTVHRRSMSLANIRSIESRITAENDFFGSGDSEGEAESENTTPRKESV
ncbi:hypothetical protein MKZ38_007205 [Zalerion maritima]|uniref:Uncharacterized protein n=1 Tax=Zalerion maritima TaxID=339359 RepID=A0AAD5RIP6_9PEZI|nr:hypothetical protein MKZ38_007205 [Zalerion maritima]